MEVHQENFCEATCREFVRSNVQRNAGAGWRRGRCTHRRRVRRPRPSERCLKQFVACAATLFGSSLSGESLPIQQTSKVGGICVRPAVRHGHALQDAISVTSMRVRQFIGACAFHPPALAEQCTAGEGHDKCAEVFTHCGLDYSLFLVIFPMWRARVGRSKQVTAFAQPVTI